jgi:hypothetical protein
MTDAGRPLAVRSGDRVQVLRGVPGRAYVFSPTLGQRGWMAAQSLAPIAAPIAATTPVFVRGVPGPLDAMGQYARYVRNAPPGYVSANETFGPQPRTQIPSLVSQHATSLHPMPRGSGVTLEPKPRPFAPQPQRTQIPAPHTLGRRDITKMKHLFIPSSSPAPPGAPGQLGRARYFNPNAAVSFPPSAYPGGMFPQ